MALSSGLTNYPVVGSSSSDSDDVEKILQSYDAVCSAEESLIDIDNGVRESIPKTFDMCAIQSFIQKIMGFVDDLSSLQKTLTMAISNSLSSQNLYDQSNLDQLSPDDIQLSIDSKYTKFVAIKIILKKFQIVKYRIENTTKTVQIIGAKAEKRALMSILKGKGSADNPVLAAPILLMEALSKAISLLMKALNLVMAVVVKIPLMKVDAAGMCFFMTPKSLKKTKMTILNVKESIIETTPDPIAKAIATVQQKINEANNAIKITRVSAMAAAGAATAGSKFDPGSFGSLEPFNPQVIKQATNAILMTLVDAEPVPRYEKLSITNIRFLVWLVTGFVPAGHKSFGIPGFP